MIAVVDVRPQSDTPALPPRLAATAAARVLGVLCELEAGPGEPVDVTIGRLVVATRVTERTVQRAIRALSGAGVVRVEESRGAASRFTVLRPGDVPGL